MAIDSFVGGLARGMDWAQTRELRNEQLESQRFDKAKREREARVYGELADLIDRYNRPQQQPAQPGIAPQAGLVAQPPTSEAAAATAIQDASAALAGDDLDPADRGMEHVPSTMEDSRQPAARQGGAQAAPRPGLAPIPMPGPQAPDERVGFGLYRNLNLLRNPQFLDEAAKLFLRAKMPEGVKWLEHGYKAQKENVITATQLALAGDYRAAEEHFNQGGSRRVVPGTMRPTEDGKQLTVQFDDGKDYTFDPRALLRSFLSPGEYFRLAHQEGQAAETTRRHQATEKNYRERTDATRQGAEARSDAAARREDRLDRREDRLGARESRLTLAQQLRNATIEDARRAVERFTPEEIKRRTSKTTVTGRENPDFDKNLERKLRRANERRYGDDEEFDRGDTWPSTDETPARAAVPRRYTVRGRSFSDADIEATARQYNMTTDQVKQQLGIR